LNSQIEVGFWIGAFLLDFPKTQIQIETLFGGNALGVSDFAIVVEDDGQGVKTKVRMQPGRIDNFVHGTTKSDVGMIAKEPNEGVIQISGVRLALRIF